MFAALKKICTFATLLSKVLLMRFRGNITHVFKAIAMMIVALAIGSCSDKQDTIVLSKDFVGEEWGRFDLLKVDYDILKAPATVDVIMELTVSEDFPNVYPFYKNDKDMLFCMLVEFPDGSHRVRDYKYPLKDRDGNWKSEKTDGYYHFKFMLISELYISESGICKFTVENKYSKDPLYGIKNMTIKCVPSKK